MTMLRKVLTASAIAIALASVPTHLAAEEREAPAKAQASVLDWFSGIWNELAALFTAKTSAPSTGPGGGPTPQAGCAVDPHGGCIDGG